MLKALRNAALAAWMWLRGSQRRGSARIRGSYDAASDGKDNLNHWENADSLSANTLNDPATRQRLRDRARFEVRNNCHAYGMVESHANDLVGTGPRLQVSIPGIHRDVTRAIENAWSNWSRAADLPEDLRLMAKADFRDGESFAITITNPALLASGLTQVSLDLAIYEAEQFADPFHWAHGLDPLYDDGIRRDTQGNPVEYTVLKSHPGGVAGGFAYDTEKFPAERVFHWYKKDRPGQARGVSTITPGLNLFAQLRRYGLAVLGTAELGASISGILKTNQPAAETNTQVSLWDEVPFARNALFTMPADWDASAFDAKQPGPMFKEFRGEVLNEIGRTGLMPRNIMTGSSAEYNYSSARADFLLYKRAIIVQRSRLRAIILDRLFLLWVQEAILAGAFGLKEAITLPPVSTWSWEWHWDGFDSIDPVKDAQCDEIELRNGTTTLADIYARKGQDWEEKIRQRARERDLLRELGLTAADALPTAGAVPAGEGEDGEPPAASAV